MLRDGACFLPARGAGARIAIAIAIATGEEEGGGAGSCQRGGIVGGGPSFLLDNVLRECYYSLVN